MGRLDKETRTLQLDQDDASYEVDLDDCLTSARVLDWIMQITAKPWATDATIAGLIRALDDVLQPQTTLCSMGSSTHMTGQQIINHVTGYKQTSQPSPRL
ncbi:hypothetical protein [Saccharopolyspora shandongensis]|uniref:hypothetical protein n=1 Tax=Saccharopolyspora shandongensis TaxID=418495 RepID=UPI0033E1861D